MYSSWDRVHLFENEFYRVFLSEPLSIRSRISSSEICIRWRNRSISRPVRRGVRITSRDGRIWHEPTLGKGGEVCRGRGHRRGAVGPRWARGAVNRFWHSSADGVTWEQTTRDGGYAGYLRSVVFVGGRFLALGGDPGSVGAADPYIMESQDGQTWSEPHKIGGKFLLRRIALGHDRYVGVGDRGRRCWSDDGRTWTDVEGTKPIESHDRCRLWGGPCLWVSVCMVCG